MRQTHVQIRLSICDHVSVVLLTLPVNVLLLF
jgi:hypothetical protein